jgi:hypothetical protein
LNRHRDFERNRLSGQHWLSESSFIQTQAARLKFAASGLCPPRARITALSRFASRGRAATTSRGLAPARLLVLILYAESGKGNSREVPIDS